MADNPTTEDAFFTRENVHTDLSNEPIAEAPKPPSLAAKIAGGVGLAVVLGAIYWFAHSGDAGALWVMNPGQDRVIVGVAGTKNEIEPMQLADLRVPAAQDVEVIVRRARSSETLTIDVRKDAEEVAIVDLGADAAYVVIDASAFYNQGPGPGVLPILHISSPHNVHYLPFPALRLVRPGRPLPDKGSWELQAFRSANSGVQIYKVFRIDAKRVGAKDKLAELLTKAIEAGESKQYETMSSFAATSTAAGGKAL